MAEATLNNQDKEVVIASVFDRVLAFLIDYAPFFLATPLPLWFMDSVMDRIFTYKDLVFALLIVHGCFIAYVTIFNSGGRRTLGKFLLNLRVLDREGKPLSVFKSFLRAIGYYVGFATFFAGFALAFLNKERRAIEDMMAGSIVVSEREKSTAENVVVAMMATAIMAMLAFGTYYQFTSSTKAQDIRAVDMAQKQLTKIIFLELQHYNHYNKYTVDINRLALISGDPVQFQRDMQKSFRRKGFKLAGSAETFAVEAVAKDSKSTKVSYRHEK
ncbi:putative membrane protein YckC [Parelusimicrobium proximum]|uniref:RDD family protein n=1 Tax=Parelusimicrobium proximum TaxID=3228953 RepID=UPI003D16AE7C